VRERTVAAVPRRGGERDARGGRGTTRTRATMEREREWGREKRERASGDERTRRGAGDGGETKVG